MSKSVKKFIAFVLIMQMIIPYPVYAAAVGKLTAVVGNVYLTRDSKTFKPAVNSAIHEKDKIETGRNSTANIAFIDDSTIAISENSKMTVQDFAVKGKTRKGIFSLTIGKLVANVTKFVGGSNAFEVHTPTAVCGVRGTGFDVVVGLVGTQMATTVTCTTGSMALSTISATGAIISTTTIVAGQTAIITSTGITVGAAGAAAGTGTAVSTATGTGTVATTGATGAAGTTAAGAAGTAGAAGAGAAGGAAAAAGIGAGTIAAATAVVAVGVAAAVAATGGGKDTPAAHHATPAHH